MPRKKKKSEITLLDILREIVKLMIFLIKAPYYIYLFFKSLALKAKKKSTELKVKKTRDSIPPVYEKFEVIHTYTGALNKWEKNLFDSESKIGIVLGARGKGKSALGIKLIENIYAKTNRKCYAMGFKAEDLPFWIEAFEDISSIKENAFVLIDEGGILFSSRKSMTKANQLLSELILVARHKNLSILFISQNSANLDVNILRQADYLLLKPSSLLQKDFERKKIKDLYEQVKYDFEVYREYKGLTYVYSDDFQGFVNNPLPSFWNVKISKSFK